MHIDVQMPRLTDPHHVPDTFVSGLGEIEDVGGGSYRFTLYSQQRDQCVVVIRAIVSIEALPTILLMAAQSIGLSLVKAATRPGDTIH